jgi:hypothetical protein
MIPAPFGDYYRSSENPEIIALLDERDQGYSAQPALSTR